MKIRRLLTAAVCFLFTTVAVAQSRGWHPDDENYSESCTSIMVGKKASTDGSVMTAHSCQNPTPVAMKIAIIIPIDSVKSP